MHRSLPRRRFSALVALSTGSLLAGCFGADDGPVPGSLTLTNDDDEPHTLTVTVGERGDHGTAGPATPTPSTPTGEADRTETYELAAGAERVERKFLTEGGRYWVRAETGTGNADSARVAVGESEHSAGGRTGHAVLVGVGEGGSVGVSASAID